MGLVTILGLVGWWQASRFSSVVPLAQAQAAAEEWVAQGDQPVGVQVETATDRPQLGLQHWLVFYGSTPSLAWSPDGSRLAFNAAYDYFGYDEAIRTNQENLGLWVYERETNQSRLLLKEQRYHPAWLGDELIASGCSPYEQCTEGLYLTGLDGSNQHALAIGVYHTLAANDHQVLFYNGFSGYTQWNRYDIHTMARETNLADSCSWEPPPRLYVDQCVQQVGELHVRSEADIGLWARWGAGPWVLIDAAPPHVIHSAAYDCAESHGGPVAPCLSPDGRLVAYVASHDWGAMELRIHALPETAEELASMFAGEDFAMPPTPSFVISSPPTGTAMLWGSGGDMVGELGGLIQTTGSVEEGANRAEGLLWRDDIEWGTDEMSGSMGGTGLLRGATPWDASVQQGTRGDWGESQAVGGEEESGWFWPDAIEGSGVTRGSSLAWNPVQLPLVARTFPDHSAGRELAMLTFDFYGDTPSLAWSPDGRKLAFNSAYRSSIFLDDGRGGYNLPQDQQGLWVVDLEQRQATRVVDEGRYHPAWAGRDRLVSGCTIWEACTTGLLLTDLALSSNRQLLSNSVYNPQAVNEHQVLYFSGNEVDSSWHRFDLDAGTEETGLSANCSWEPPAELMVDQCLQQVGPVRVWVQVPTGLYAQIGDGDPIRLDPSPPWIYEDMGVWGCPRSNYHGPIAPCLSPDGRHVAYVTRGAVGLSLHLVEIPQAP
ncbi:MAG: PD40 domain-containing protein [Bradymonadales bacterium]|nr:PD40 domain-containing protein [Bradymonadales bacterium]